MNLNKTSSRHQREVYFVSSAVGINMEKEKQGLDVLMSKKYALVPPDGGWGYLVAISAIICFTTTTSWSGSFGMLYNEFMNKISMSSASVTLLSGIFSVSLAFSGFFTSPLLKIMSKRKLAFAASVVFSCGTLGAVIMTSALMFFISVGVMQGTGLGILYNLSCTLVNDYFIEKRLLIMSFVQTATGVMAMIAPMFVKWSLDHYGSRGTLLLIGGISLHNFIAVFLMQPVKWHMKKVEVSDSVELKKLLGESNDVKKMNTPVIKLTDLEGNTKAAQEKGPDFPDKYKPMNGIRKMIESLIDTSLFKTFLLSCASFGPAMCCTTDGIYLIMIPQYLYSMGWSQENVAMAVALYSFGDLATRIMYTIISKWMFKLGIPKIYIVGIAVAFFSTLGMLCSKSVIAAMVCFTLMGVAHCSVSVLFPIVISDAVAPEQFTSAMGICLLLNGLLSIAIGPAIGAVRDLTNSYSIAFHTLTSAYAIIAILWSIELIVRNKRRKVVKTSSNEINKLAF